LTLPFELRGRLGFDGKLLGAVARIFTDSVLGWYRRRLRSSRRERDESGAVVVVQRASSDLKLNPHLHATPPRSRVESEARESNRRARLRRTLRRLNAPPSSDSVRACCARAAGAVART
jgi:hypothetical protein